MVLAIDDVWCVSYAVAIGVCAAVVAPIVAFFTAIPSVYRFGYVIAFAYATAEMLVVLNEAVAAYNCV